MNEIQDFDISIIQLDQGNLRIESVIDNINEKRIKQGEHLVVVATLVVSDLRPVRPA